MLYCHLTDRHGNSKGYIIAVCQLCASVCVVGCIHSSFFSSMFLLYFDTIFFLDVVFPLVHIGTKECCLSGKAPPLHPKLYTAFDTSNSQCNSSHSKHNEPC